MTNPLSNLRLLRDDMVTNDNAVSIFLFKYRSNSYYCAVCLLTDKDRGKAELRYALVRLCFIRTDDLIDWRGNSPSFMWEMKAPFFTFSMCGNIRES